MPFPGDAFDPDRDAGSAGATPGRRMTTRARLLFPVIFCLLVQVPSVFFHWNNRRFGVATDAPGPLVAVELALNIAGPLALLAARRYPGPVVAAVALCAVADLFVDGGNVGPPFIALGFAIVGAVVRGARIWAWTSVATAWLVCLSLASLLGTSWPAYRVVFTTVGVVILLGLAESVRSRRDRFAALRRVADERRASDLQAERVRIARELHDVLAHSLSQINVQASVGLHLADAQPAQARTALANIKESSKSALDEVRSVLGMLRSDVTADAAPLLPEPDLARLPSLIASVRAQGLDVTFTGSGTDGSLQDSMGDDVPPATQLALYRIVQESLTNVMRHAGATQAHVDLRESGGLYTVTVADNGQAGSLPAREGRGLLGMRERAELLGGTLEVGPGAEGGFTVTARIPLARVIHRSASDRSTNERSTNERSTNERSANERSTSERTTNGEAAKP